MIREIQINAVLNGFVVKIGCQTVVFTSVDDLTTKLNEYFKNPQETENNFLKDNAINAQHTGLGGLPSGIARAQFINTELPTAYSISGVATGAFTSADSDPSPQNCCGQQAPTEARTESREERAP